MKKIFAVLQLLLVVMLAQAQMVNPVKFSTSLKTNGTAIAEIVFNGKIQSGWHVYFWHGGHHLRVNNCDDRHVMRIYTYEFSLSLNICDNVVDGNLSCSTCCSWNCNNRNARILGRCGSLKDLAFSPFSGLNSLISQPIWAAPTARMSIGYTLSLPTY